MSSTPVPDPPIFDLRKPYPKAIIEGLRRATVQAIDDLAETVTDVRANTLGVDDAYFLADALFELVGAALTAVDDLASRVAALEAALSPTDPTPEVAP